MAQHSITITRQVNWLIEWYATSVFDSHALPPAVNFASIKAKYHSSFYGQKP
jgi:hypothetical protein